MLIYSFITDYQAFNLRYKDNTTRDKNETKVGKQSANLGKNNEPIQNRLSFLIDCKSVILHHFTILSFPMVRPAWDNWWLLVATESGQVAIEIYNNDSPMTVKIKEFMALYGIVDIKMRMLRIPELKKIMGFPEDYVLIGTQADQKKFIGNAVEVTQARKNTEALCKVLKKLRLKKLKEIA